MPMYNLFTYEINLTLTWSEKYVLSNNTKVTTLAIIDIKIYIPVGTLSTQDNAKLLQQFQSSFKRTINWKIIKSKNRSSESIFISWLIEVFKE